MRHPIVAIFLLIAVNCFCQTPPKLTISKLTDKHFVYTTYNKSDGVTFPSNSMYLVTKKGVVLIDTPWDSTQFQPVLDSIKARHGQNVVMCISTHFHADRTAGLDFLKRKGIKTYTSKKTYDLCKARGEKQSEFYFRNDTTFTVGSEKFTAYHPGEGHSPDNIIIWFENERILYGGCLIKSVASKNLGNIADANLSAWKPTMENLIRKYPNPRFIIPGHFDWNGDGLQHTIKLLNEEKAKNNR